MKSLLNLIMIIALAGCGTFGHAQYEITHAPGGGCDFKANDGKEFAGRRMGFNGADCTVQIFEGDSKAFAGQAIGAKVMTVMPVTGLDKLVPPADPVILVK